MKARSLWHGGKSPPIYGGRGIVLQVCKHGSHRGKRVQRFLPSRYDTREKVGTSIAYLCEVQIRMGSIVISEVGAGHLFPLC